MARSAAPDVLVLGVGGILGEAWMTGVLAGLARATGADFARSGAFVGSSAGSIVAATLAAGAPLDVLADEARQPPAPRAARASPRRPQGLPSGAARRAAHLALVAGAPGGALLRAALLARAPRGRIPLDELRRRIAALPAGFDGRLRVVAVDVRSGRRVVFGAPGAPAATVADAVAASCAVPGLFRPVVIGGRTYVDGGVWSPTNLDVAPVRRGARVLCLVPTAALEAAPASMLRALARAWSIATALEAAAARSRGARVTVVEPDGGSAAAMGANLMDPGPRARVRAAGHAQGLAAASALAG